MTDERTRLETHYEAFREKPFPSEWNRLTERFGEPDECPELRSDPDFDRLTEAWGSPDLILHDGYLAGHVSTILASGEAGADVIGQVERDRRIDRYLDLCVAEAKDEETRRQVEVCRRYLAELNEMLEVARSVPRR